MTEFQKRQPISLSFFGETKTASQWATDSRCEVSKKMLIGRLERGWPVDDPGILKMQLEGVVKRRFRVILPNGINIGQFPNIRMAELALQDHGGKGRVINNQSGHVTHFPPPVDIKKIERKRERKLEAERKKLERENEKRLTAEQRKLERENEKRLAADLKRLDAEQKKLEQQKAKEASSIWKLGAEERKRERQMKWKLEAERKRIEQEEIKADKKLALGFKKLAKNFEMKETKRPPIKQQPAVEKKKRVPREVAAVPERKKKRGLRREVVAWGATKTVREWLRDSRCVVPYKTLSSRLRHKGSSWTAEEMLSTPVMSARGAKLHEAFGERKTLEAWSADSRCQVSLGWLTSQVRRGLPIEFALKGVRRRDRFVQEAPVAEGPVFSRKELKKNYEAFGEKKPLSEWLEDPRCVASQPCVKHRIDTGLKLQRAISTPDPSLRARRAG